MFADFIELVSLDHILLCDLLLLQRVLLLAVRGILDTLGCISFGYWIKVGQFEHEFVVLLFLLTLTFANFFLKGTLGGVLYVALYSFLLQRKRLIAF